MNPDVGGLFALASSEEAHTAWPGRAALRRMGAASGVVVLCAVLLGGLQIYGLQPGPLLLEQRVPGGSVAHLNIKDTNIDLAAQQLSEITPLVQASKSGLPGAGAQAHAAGRGRAGLVQTRM